MPLIKFDDFELYYEKHGSGPPLLLVTGLGGFADYWAPQIAAFGEHFTVITHDHRGVGQSTHSKIDYSVDQMSDDLVRLMDALKIERAHLLGHSTGGAIGQTIALDHPDRVASLTLSATWTKADPFMQRVFEARKILLRLGGPEPYVRNTATIVSPDWWVNENIAAIEEADARNIARLSEPEIVLSRIDAVLGFDRASEIARIDAPTLVICAADDYLTPLYFSEEISRTIPGAKLHVISKGGHVCSQTRADEFNAAVLPFLLSQR